MTELRQIYKCNVCGNIVEVVHKGVGQLVCCGQPMQLQEEKQTEEGLEKHLPVIEKQEDHVNVTVGSILHPMEENHYIEWIEAVYPNGTCRKTLKPGEEPTGLFDLEDLIEVRAYCNVHGLWKATP